MATSGPELNFEEFRAVRRRRQTDEEDERLQAVQQDEPASENVSHRAGVFVEMQEVQFVMAMLIILDLAAASFEVAAACPQQGVGEVVPSALVRLTQSFTGFTIFLFFFELVALVAAFGLVNFCRHPGYVVDAIVVGLCLRSEIVSPRKVARMRLLAFVRLWRLARLHDAFLSDAHRQTDAARSEALLQQERALKVEVARARLESALGEAAASRERLERMCRAYKDEIDTLNEALAIAAMDIAEAADSEIESTGDKDEPVIPTAAKRKRPVKPTKFIVDKSGAYHEEQDATHADDDG